MGRKQREAREREQNEIGARISRNLDANREASAASNFGMRPGCSGKQLTLSDVESLLGGSPSQHVSHGPTAMRFGQRVHLDEAHFAAASQDVGRMVAALRVRTNDVDRHYLLSALVRALYNRRTQPGCREQLIKYADVHICELPTLLRSLERNRNLNRRARAAYETHRGNVDRAHEIESLEDEGDPHVDTFLLACRAHCEVERYANADLVWQAAHRMGYLSDEGLAQERAGIEKRRRKNDRAKGAPIR